MTRACAKALIDLEANIATSEELLQPPQVNMVSAGVVSARLAIASAKALKVVLELLSHTVPS